MSEIIVHTAVSDDIIRIASSCTDLNPLTRSGVDGPMELHALGSSTRHADKHSVTLLRRIRDDGGATPERIDQLAFMLGWITHRAADRQMKPVFRANPDPEGRSPKLCSVYQDAFVFAKLMVPAGRDPYDPDMWHLPLDAAGPGNRGAGSSLMKIAAAQPARSGEAGEPGGEPAGSRPDGSGRMLAEAQRLVTMMFQRALLSFHTFVPDDDNVEEWLNHVSGLVQRRRNDLSRYVEAILNPDPELVKRYITDLNFYNEADPIIVAARDVQHRGLSMTLAEARSLTGASHYGQAMQMGLHYVLAADAFLAGRIDEAKLEQELDIGKLGRDGKWV